MAWSRSNSQDRGYGTEWRKLRRVVLQRDCYACQCDECGKLPVRRTAAQVDHIVQRADGGDDSLENLRSVSVECHQRITTLAKGQRPRDRIGLDGYPVDVFAPAVRRTGKAR